MLNWDYQGDEVDVYTPLTWEEMWDFKVETAREMKRDERVYKEWLENY